MLTKGIGDRFDGSGHAVFGRRVRRGLDRICQLIELV